MKTYLKLVMLITIVILFMSSLWALDIGVSVLNLENSGVLAQAKGFAFARDGNHQYHLGLILSGVMFMIVCFMYLWEVIVSSQKNHEEAKDI